MTGPLPGNPRGANPDDTAVLAAVSATPEIVFHIATRLESDVIEVERALYRLAQIRPGQIQPPGTGHVVCHRSRPGVPVLWSRPDLR